MALSRRIFRRNVGESALGDIWTAETGLLGNTGIGLIWVDAAGLNFLSDDLGDCGKGLAASQSCEPNLLAQSDRQESQLGILGFPGADWLKAALWAGYLRHQRGICYNLLPILPLNNTGRWKSIRSQSIKHVKHRDLFPARFFERQKSGHQACDNSRITAVVTYDRQCI